MKFSERLSELRREIVVGMGPLITSDYYLLEVPTHTNVGDYLIWQGEIDYLSTLPYKCLGMHSSVTFRFDDIDSDAVILLNGGGSFGDVWPESMEFKLNVVMRYPDNKIVFFPQSVHFQDCVTEKRALTELSKHSNLTICVRDKYSHEYLSNAGLKSVLIPDMAFFFTPKGFEYMVSSCGLLVTRDDRESKYCVDLAAAKMNEDLHLSDWSTIDRRSFVTLFFDATVQIASRIKLFLPLVDFFSNMFYRKYIIYEGCRHIGAASFVYATRLHAGVLALLMGKNVVLFDNSYGKISRFYETWLQSCDEVSLRR